jgi:hypothetical protein
MTTNAMKLPSWEANSRSASQKSSHFMETEGSLPWSQEPATTRIQSTHSHTISQRSILILSSHLRLDLPRGIFPSIFRTKILYALLIFPMRATCLAHLILIDLITLIIFCEGSTNYKAPHYAVFSGLLSLIRLGSKYSPKNFVLKHPQSVYPTSLILRDQVSHPYKTTGSLYYTQCGNWKTGLVLWGMNWCCHLPQVNMNPKRDWRLLSSGL